MHALLAVLLLCPSLTVDEALAAARRGESLEARVTPAVAGEAAQRLTRAPTADLDGLLAVARAGAADAAATRALGARIDLDDPSAPLAARLLAGLPAGAPSPGVAARLAERQVDEETTRAACALLVRGSDAGAVAARIETWATDPALTRALLAAVTAGPRPGELFAAVARVELPDPVHGQRVAALGELVATQADARAQALAMVDGGERGAGHAALRALARWPLDRYDEVAGPIERALDEGRDDAGLLAAALEAAAGVFHAAGAAVARERSARGYPAEVRAAALRAMGALCQRDAATIDALIAALDDREPAVARAAHEALLRRTSAGLGPTASLWRTWRARQSLPEAVDDEEYLARERRIRARASRRRGGSE